MSQLKSSKITRQLILQPYICCQIDFSPETHSHHDGGNIKSRCLLTKTQWEQIHTLMTSTNFPSWASFKCCGSCMTQKCDSNHVLEVLGNVNTRQVIPQNNGIKHQDPMSDNVLPEEMFSCPSSSQIRLGTEPDQWAERDRFCNSDISEASVSWWKPARYMLLERSMIWCTFSIALWVALMGPRCTMGGFLGSLYWGAIKNLLHSEVANDAVLIEEQKDPIKFLKGVLTTSARK